MDNNNNIINAIINVNKALDILYKIKTRQIDANLKQQITQSRKNTDKKLENIFIDIENNLIN